jgi:hypothetical protein
VQLFIVLLLLFNNGATVISLIAIHLFKGDIALWQHTPDWKQWMLMNARLYVAALGISALQFWMGMRFRNFIASIGIGFLLWLLAVIMLANFQWKHANVFPFSSSMLIVFPKYASMIPTLLWSSVGYMVLFLTAGFVDFRTRRMY